MYAPDRYGYMLKIRHVVQGILLSGVNGTVVQYCLESSTSYAALLRTRSVYASPMTRVDKPKRNGREIKCR